jgi:DOMON domain
MKKSGPWRTKAALAYSLGLVLTAAITAFQADPPPRVPAPDGLIGAQEYGPPAHFKGRTGIEFLLYARPAGGDVIMAMRARTNGWLAVGVEPADDFHKHADMIFGWVDAQGIPHVVDAFSPDSMGPHPADEELGGTPDIKAFNGTEIDGVTTIEFVRASHLTDHFDHDVEMASPVPVIWAVGANDDWSSGHRDMGRGLAAWESGATRVPITLWPLHALLMISGFSFMASGIIVALKKDGVVWMKTHRLFERLGALLTFTWALLGVIMVGLPLSNHLDRLHSYSGILIPALAGLVLFSGGLLLKPEKGPPGKRRLHRYLAWLLAALMAFTVIEGFFAVGIW